MRTLSEYRADRLSRIIKESGVNKAWLSVQTGIDHRRISEYCRGANIPLDDVCRIVYALGISCDELLCFDKFLEWEDER